MARAALGLVVPPYEREGLERAVTMARDALGDAAFDAAWAEAAALPLEEAVALALAPPAPAAPPPQRDHAG